MHYRVLAILAHHPETTTMRQAPAELCRQRKLIGQLLQPLRRKPTNSLSPLCPKAIHDSLVQQDSRNASLGTLCQDKVGDVQHTSGERAVQREKPLLSGSMLAPMLLHPLSSPVLGDLLKEHVRRRPRRTDLGVGPLAGSTEPQHFVLDPSQSSFNKVFSLGEKVHQLDLVPEDELAPLILFVRARGLDLPEILSCIELASCQGQLCHLCELDMARAANR